ncbi:MAG: DUF998 domain-containing protein [Candidatus Hodarchaeales archaeon]
MKYSNWRQWTFIFVVMAAGAFIILTLIGMLVYQGGTYDQPANSGYSFLNNFFSDLGRTVAHSGKVNTLSWLFFTVALFIIGLGLVVFFFAWIDLFREDSHLFLMSRVGSTFGIISGLAYLGVAFTPSDLLPDPHLLFVRIGFLGTFIAAIFYSYSLNKHSNYQKLFVYSFATFSTIVFIYIILLFFGPSIETAEGLFIQVTGQKIIVYFMALSYSIQGYGAYKGQKTVAM